MRCIATNMAEEWENKEDREEILGRWLKYVNLILRGFY